MVQEKHTHTHTKMKGLKEFMVLILQLFWKFEITQNKNMGNGDICIRIADSLCYTAETNTPL